MAARTLVVTALILWVGGVYAAPPQEDLNKRLTRLERLLESQTLGDMLLRIESLQQEVQQLRGRLEEQDHAMQSLQRRQRELYLDMDRRLSRLEQAAGSSSNNELSTTAEAVAEEADEQGAYQNAFDLLRDLRYEQATAAFRRFLERYPDGRYAHVAQYWIGEASYAQRDFKEAIVAYERLVQLHPRSPKVAEAMLKVGASYNELGDKAAASKVLNELIAKHPNTTEAGQARTLLQQIKREG
jgi:tol-pal system protein YbgF